MAVVVKGAVVVVAEEDKVVDEVKVAVRTVEALALAEIPALEVVLTQLLTDVRALSYDSLFLPRLQ
jgi:hypothetical protein